MTKTLVRARGTLPLAAAVACAAFGCAFTPANLQNNPGSGNGSGNGQKTIPGLTSLTISPTSATVSVSSGGPAKTQQYRVTGTVNGHSQDVTDQVGYSLSSTSFVKISSGGLATTLGTGGGLVTITAAASGYSATATLTVQYGFTGPDPGMPGQGVPPNSGTIFSTSKNDASRAPQLIYPNDGVLFPPNVTGIEVHFMPGNNNTLFEVTFAGPVSTVNTFIRCQSPQGISGCIYLPDATIWSAVAISNAGQGQVTLTVRGTDDSGSSVGASSSFHMSFARDPVEGALYYWTTSGKTAIMRWDFGGSTTTATAYLTPTNTDGSTCVGCHALAPDGSKIVPSAGGQNDGHLLLWDIARNMALEPYPLSQQSQFESWNAAGTQFVGVYGDATHKAPSNLMIFDGTMGTVMQTIDLGGLRADHPDWSKNTSGANTIAFTTVDPVANTTDQRPATGGIDFIQFDGTNWGAPQVLVPPQLGNNRYYPAIAPDGNLVVYDESTCTNGTPTMGQPADKSCDADTDATATIMFTSLGGGTPVPLAHANGPGVADGMATALTNSFPKWAPFVERLDEMSSVYWLTFSSTRQYGLRTPPAPADMDETTKGTLIWMVGISPGIGGGDPSFTSFCLPFQDITTSNHIAQWTKAFIQGPG
ncbi:MAG TPA: hypothetical protein VI456_13820 [Polyangia bacterium]